MNNYVVIIIFFGALLLIYSIYKFILSKGSDKLGYVKKKLLTDNEFEFFNRLVRALPEFYICPQVCMGAILDAKAKDYEVEKKLRYTFGYKIVDFVVYSKNKEIIAIVELDDRTHDKEKDYSRDLMLREAGYKILRFESKKKPRTEEIAKIFANLNKS